jgi:hypothetical protein
MSLNLCPATVVAAPVEVVWELLSHLGRYGEWADAQVQHVEPQGPAAVGQTMTATSRAFGRTWSVSFTVNVVKPERHQLGMHVILPLGLQMDEYVSCTPVTVTTCRVQYG